MPIALPPASPFLFIQSLPLSSLHALSCPVWPYVPSPFRRLACLALPLPLCLAPCPYPFAPWRHGWNRFCYRRTFLFLISYSMLLPCLRALCNVLHTFYMVLLVVDMRRGGPGPFTRPGAHWHAVTLVMSLALFPQFYVPFLCLLACSLVFTCGLVAFVRLCVISSRCVVSSLIVCRDFFAELHVLF